MASRFVLVIFIAKFLSTEELGAYSLFSASITYALFFVGMDFYTFSSREILSVDKPLWYGIIKNQYIFYFIFYLIAFPLIYSFFYLGFLPKQFIIWFYLILIAEHLAQESMRLLVVLNRAFLANVALFIRSGVWVYAAVLVMFLNTDMREIKVILILWLLGSCVSILLVVPELLRLRKITAEDTSVDFSWMWKGVKIAAPLLIGTLALRSIYLVDRYSLSYFSNLSIVGIYSFYSSFASALLAFVDAVVVMQIYPKIVSSVKNKDFEVLAHFRKKFIRAVSFLSLTLVVVLPVGVYVLLLWMKKTEYIEYMPLLAALMLSSIIYSYALLPHYELYAYNEDKKIIISSVFAALVGVITMPIGAYFFGVYGVAIGQVLAVMFLYIYKILLLKKRKLYA
ncbi:lipopolysaccharide biosynthesis protein [Enterobacter cancerogenus]|uniref:lipopolysaccharide biosynthesis protein n=1 Tax=Enterobacter cancerogenus TaxID=69218 RepID=UPI00384F385B